MGTVSWQAKSAGVLLSRGLHGWRSDNADLPRLGDRFFEPLLGDFAL